MCLMPDYPATASIHKKVALQLQHQAVRLQGGVRGAKIGRADSKLTDDDSRAYLSKPVDQRAPILQAPLVRFGR